MSCSPSSSGSGLPTQWTVGAGGNLTIEPTSTATPVLLLKDTTTNNVFSVASSDGTLEITPHAGGGAGIVVTQRSGSTKPILQLNAASDQALGIDLLEIFNKDSELVFWNDGNGAFEFADGTGTVFFAGGTGGHLGFFGTAPIAKPTGVAVSAAGIHAALVSLGLIAA